MTAEKEPTSLITPDPSTSTTGKTFVFDGRPDVAHATMVEQVMDDRTMSIEIPSLAQGHPSTAPTPETMTGPTHQPLMIDHLTLGSSVYS